MSVSAVDNIDLAKGHGQGTMQGTIQEAKSGHGRISVDLRDDNNSLQKESYPDAPTEEELQTLRRVSGKIPMVAWTIAFCELCERFSYYGTSIVYTNFMAWPLPDGSNTGAGGTDGQSGALGRGTKFATSLSLFNQFWAYVMPLLGAYIADAHLGRLKTIHIAILVSIVAHTVLVAAAAPAVIVKQQSSTAAFIIGLVTLGIGTGMFKANVSPLLAEQVKDTRMRVKTLPKTGERVIVDPAVTNTRIFLYFYMCINTGSLVGQITMVYAEKYVGFWLAWLLPTVLFLIAPVILFCFRKQYYQTPPAGSVLSKFFRMFFYAMKGHWTSPKSFTWDVARPSNVSPEARPKWMTYDDAWVDEVRRGLKACKVFCFLPLFHLAYNQMTNNLTSQAATMELHGVPNDLIQNLNPISIVIMIPILDHVVYPGFRKMGFNFSPIKRMCTGFFFGAAAMVAATVMQYYIYKLAPCGRYPSDPDCIKEKGPAPINVWAQLIPYVLIGLSELFTNVTSYEYAFSKAPSNMKSLVMSVNLFMSAFASAIQQAWAPLTEDPLLEWNYGSVAVLAAAGGALFWFCFRKLDKEEDKWNSLEKSAYQGKSGADVSGRNGSVAGSVAQTQVAHEKV